MGNPTTNLIEKTSQIETAPVNWEITQFHHRINSLAYAATSKELFQNALNLLIEFTQADSATYFRFDPDHDELIVEAVCRDDESQFLVGLRLPKQETLLQMNLAESQPIIIGDLPGDPRWLRALNPKSVARMINLVSLPLIIKNELWGVIQIYNFTCANLDWLGILQERIAIEFERRDLLERTQLRSQRLLNLIEVIGEASGLVDRKQILHKVLEKATDLVDAERTSIFLSDPESGSIGFQIAYQTPQPQERSTRSYSSKVHEAQSPSTHSGREPAQLVSRSAITVPIRLQPAEGNTEDFRSLGGMMALNPKMGSFTSEDLQIMNILAQHTSSFLQVAEIFESTEELFLDVIKALAAAIDAKDPYTQGHSHRVSEYSVLIAQELGLSQGQINDIRIGSLLHDVGKIGIPDVILKKTGKLLTEEWDVIKNHPITGGNILRQVRLLEPILPAIVEHHEKLNGSGYPHGLRGEQISIMGRIVAVADVFDAMTSDRPYRQALKIPDVITYLEENAGTLFDPDCVVALMNIVARNQMSE
jgi:HD-GYP domain-containing protein (c-di-GMP phosphodiesterase class II)